jgi:hypothetical protein
MKGWLNQLVGLLVLTAKYNQKSGRPSPPGAYQGPSDIHMVLSKVVGYHLIRYLVEIEHEEAAGRPHREIEAEKMSLLHQLVDAVVGGCTSC